MNIIRHKNMSFSFPSDANASKEMENIKAIIVRSKRNQQHGVISSLVCLISLCAKAF
jgi:hypothetical protein